MVSFQLSAFLCIQKKQLKNDEKNDHKTTTSFEKKNVRTDKNTTKKQKFLAKIVVFRRCPQHGYCLDSLKANFSF